MAGDPLLQIRSMSEAAEPGDIVVSREAWDLAGSHCLGDSLSEGSRKLLVIREELEPKRLASPVLTTDLEPALRAYIPNTVLARLDAGQVDWLDELRRITTLFISVSEIDYGGPDAFEML
ncbi:MAG: hypothetical protein IH940_12610, partial [Acidobacteria bacterium]|nr:hypothetical protein [Acidobacteriota bacterium]